MPIETSVEMPGYDPRDFVGYGRNPPHPRWPGDARIAVNIALNYEAGGSKASWMATSRPRPSSPTCPGAGTLENDSPTSSRSSSMALAAVLGGCCASCASGGSSAASSRSCRPSSAIPRSPLLRSRTGTRS